MEVRSGPSVQQLEAVASIARANAAASEAPASVATSVSPGGSDVKAPASVPVWDSAVRVFHWSLVIAVAVAWITGGSGHRAHEITGFVVVGLVAFRLIWGFVGTQHALFKDFVAGPRTIRGYLRALAQHRAERHLGHNPAGGAMILVILALLSVIVVSGYMQITPQYFGVVWVENLHHYSANTLLALIPLHVIGVIVSSWLHQENLLKAMFTGRKPAGIEHRSVDSVRERQLLLRVRSSEGQTMMMMLVGASAAFGVFATSGRGVVGSSDVAAVTSPSVVEAAQAAPAPSAPVVAQSDFRASATATTTTAPPASVGQRPPGQERQDFVGNYGPDRASRTWLISSGGRLYDRWFTALGIAPPTTTHPSWPAANKDIAGSETWRCKTCHGWDYLGRDGQYGSGPSASGAPGLQRVRNRSVEDIVLILSGPKHQYGEDMLPHDAKIRLALFLREGQHLATNHITKDGTIRGNAVVGKTVFENVCASCHGFDGRQRKLGVSAASTYDGPPLFVGTKTVSNPVEVLHKIRNGHPGAIMASMRAFPVDVSVNVLAYTMTLPPR